MADEILARDQNRITVLGGVTDDSNQFVTMLRVDPITKRLLCLSNTILANPMTTGGDIIYGGASGVPTRLANGTAGQVLTSNGTTLAPSWEDAGGGGAVSTATVTLSQSDVNNLHTTPVTLLAAQGANTVIQILSVFFYYDYGTSAFAGGGNVNIRYNNANDDIYNFTDYTGTADYMVWGHTSGYNRPLSYGENLPLTLGNAGAAITGGIDSTITCTITYIVVNT